MDALHIHILSTANSPGTQVPPQTSSTQCSPTSIPKCMQVIQGDVLTRVMTFLSFSDAYHLGQINHTYTQLILSKKRKIPWINIEVSLLIENYIRQVLFTNLNEHKLIDSQEYLQLIEIEQAFEKIKIQAKIFPSSHIHRFDFHHQQAPYTIERVMEHMPNLQYLSLSSATPANLISFSGFTALKELEIANCSQLTNADLSHLNRLTNLETLSLYECSQITDIDLQLVGLQGLFLYNLSTSQQVTHMNLETCSALQNLRIVGNTNININVIGLSKLSQLRELHLVGSVDDDCLTQIKILTKLQDLSLSYCSQVTDIGLRKLSHLTELGALQLSLFPQITDNGLEHLSSLSALHTLELYKCPQITDISLRILEAFTALKTLKIIKGVKITDLGLIHVSPLTALRHLDLSKCLQITDIGLSHLQSLAASLQRLDLSETQLTDVGLSRLGTFTQLRMLNLCYCDQLTGSGFIHFKALTALQKLHLIGCSRINDSGIEHLTMCTGLRLLCLHECLLVTQVGLKSLETLHKLKVLKESDR